ncbi:MAG: ATP-dependent helicase C-terminal domain-containing protein, partial [Paracoccaceae bacterium]
LGAGSAGRLLARAYPDRIAMRRPGAGPRGEARHLLSGGKGAWLPAEDPLAGEAFIVAADLDGDTTEARIRRAAAIDRAALEEIFSDRMTWRESCAWSRRERRVLARRRLMLGALALEERPWPEAPEEAQIAAMTEGVRDLGLAALPWSEAAAQLAARAEWARRGGADIAALDEASLVAALEEWLSPWLGGLRRAEDLPRLDLFAILSARLGRDGLAAIDRAAPAAFTPPTGGARLIDYSDQPRVSLRLQELFGLDRHPMAGGSPLVLELLSPAGRPVQLTADLPAFWRSSYADVRKDMRGRYPRHPWPEDPLSAAPTQRANPRRTRGGS